MSILGCNPKAIPTVIFPAKPEAEPGPGKAIVSVFAKDSVNPAPEGSPSPVQVRIFAAEDKTLFDNASFEEVFEFQELEFELKPKLTTTIKPGSVDGVTFELEPEETTIAIAVAFRDIGRAEWLKLIDVDSTESTRINFVLSEYTVKHESEIQ